MAKLALTYDDIQLIPRFSDVASRPNISLKTKVSRRYGLLIPLVGSPMDTVCEYEMAFKLFQKGGVGCIHRFMSIEEQSEQISRLNYLIYGEGFGGPYERWDLDSGAWHSEINKVPIMAAIGVSETDKERAISLTKNGANIILIDVAHGHHQNVINMIRWCKENLPTHVDVIAGNIATAEAAIDLQEAGADGLRCGIGGGSLCTSRIKTGFGIPNVTCLEEIAEVATVPIMADGGIRTSGDITKALAVGADVVMLGSLLAGTEESPGKIIETSEGALLKRYRGSASLETKTLHGQAQRNVEGESTTIPFKGGVKFIIEGLIDGVRSALSYGGASNLQEYCPGYVQVTSSGVREAHPHLVR
jgi:IMP dehydrogenase